VAKNEKGYILSDRTPAAYSDLETPRHLSKQEFGRRIYRIMTEKGLRQSELARRADLPRNNVSSYVRGLSYPSRMSLVKLAKALGVEPDILLPNYNESAIRSEETPDLALRSSMAEPGMSWLVVNRQVSTAIGVEILGLLEKDRADAGRK
jgi:transcriptional regulator with XRE-family HTH domain